ncbi:MAG: Spx/MgsR family RNA polymerase-binding regulatory protein [Planctomycetes bacterium]|nr:Spx/MgsR family RNA polymerase-binding regulatory protein [Planctomycetota bacterium]
MITVYAYQNCSTCRKALKHLDAKGARYQVKAIRETPPTVAELKRMLAQYGGEVRRLFNTSGQDYRTLGLSAKLATMSEADALKLLASNGNLVKRPFALTKKHAVVGFDPAAWKDVVADA